MAGELGHRYDPGVASGVRRIEFPAHAAAAEGAVDSQLRRPHRLSLARRSHQAQAARQGRRTAGRNPQFDLALMVELVMRGLDPRIDPEQSIFWKMDGRVKPGHDELDNVSALSAAEIPAAAVLAVDFVARRRH